MSLGKWEKAGPDQGGGCCRETRARQGRVGGALGQTGTLAASWVLSAASCDPVIAAAACTRATRHVKTLHPAPYILILHNPKPIDDSAAACKRGAEAGSHLRLMHFGNSRLLGGLLGLERGQLRPRHRCRCLHTCRRSIYLWLYVSYHCV